MAATENLDALNIPIGLGSVRQDKTNDLRVDFGDGYSQRGRDGINPTKQEWAIIWDNLTTASLVILMDFLRPLQSNVPFLWTPPRQSVQLQWTVVKNTLRERPKVGNAVSDVRVRFQQEFDL